MKKSVFLTVLVCLMAFGLLFAACDTDGGGDSHQWGAWTVITAADCAAAGEESRTCTEHDPAHTETRPIPAGHLWGEWTLTTAPTATAAGEETRTCQRDPAHSETRPVPPTGGGTPGALEVTIDREDSTPTSFGFSVDPVNGATYQYRVGTGGAWVTSPTHNFSVTAGLNSIEFTPVTAQTLVGGVVQKESTIPGMFKYAAANNLVQGYTDLFNVLITGFETLGELYPEVMGAPPPPWVGHTQAYQNAIYALDNSILWNTNTAVEELLNPDRKMYDDLTMAILPYRDEILDELDTAGKKAFNDQLRRLWLNGVPGHTDPAIDPLLNSIIEAEIKGAHPGVVLVR